MFGRLLCLILILEIGASARESARMRSENVVRLRKVLQRSRDQSGFLNAVQTGDLAELERLHREGFNVNEPILGSYTAIHIASANGKTGVAGRLIRWGANVNARGKNGITALHMAAHRGNARMAGLLLGAQADVNAMDNQRLTPLHFAASRNLPNGYSVEELSRSPKGIRDPYAETQHSTVKAYSPSFAPNQLEVVSMLLRQGADPNAGNEVGETPLHYAASDDKDKVTKLLISWDANIEKEDVQRERPLHEAVAYGAKNVVGVLLKSGANTYAKEQHGLSPREFVCECQKYKTDPSLAKCFPGKCAAMVDRLIIESMIDKVRSRRG